MQVESLGPGVMLYSGMSCVLVEHSIVCWNVVSSDPARLPKLLATQIHFDGHKPASLVPKWALNSKVQP